MTSAEILKFCQGNSIKTEEQTRLKLWTSDAHRSERGLVLDPRPKYETQDAEVATPVFEKQGLPHPSPDASKELKLFKSRISNANSIYKAASQDPNTEFITLAFKGF